MKNLLFVPLILLSGYLSAQVSEAPSLSCVRNAGSDIELFWTLPVTNCGGAFNSYDIYISNSFNGPYTLEQSVTDVTVTSTVVNNPASTVFYFYMITNRACPAGTAFPTSDTLDNIKPQPSPRILSVDVNMANQIEVSWTASSSKEIVGYLIYNDNNGFNTPDTVYGRTNTTFTDLTGNPFNKTNRYFIRTLEYCENDTGFLGSSFTDSSILEIHSSILLKYTQQNKCERTARIGWNKYENYGFEGGITGYIIWVDSNGTGLIPIDTISPTDSLYNVPDIYPGVIYDVRVSALLPRGFEAFSNPVSLTGQTTPLPLNFHIYNATPVADGTVEISYYNELPDAIKDIQLQRSSNGINFDNINGQEQTPPGAVIRIFKDGNAKPNERALTFRFLARDSCDVQYNSGSINTIYLAGKEKKDGGIDLFWNAFNVTDGAADQFELVKYFNGIETDRFILSTSTLVYTDVLPFRPDVLDTVCYQIEVPFTVQLGTASANNITYSNRICFTPEPKAYVPNAFKPEGIKPENRRIKPNLTYATDEGYLFQIFNRYGETMFSSGDRTKSWDGQYNGEEAPLDSYIYVVNFQGLDGKEKTKTGVIMLLK